MNPKYWRSTSPICPWCEAISPKTGNVCGHLYKLTVKGVYWWYWGYRPLREEQVSGYCICPRADGSAPDDQHASNCESARQAIRKAEGREER